MHNARSAESNLVFESGVSIPSRGSNRKYRLYELEINQSLFIPVDESHLRKFQVRLAACMRYQTKHTGRVYTQRIVRSGITGIRVWRIH